MMGLYALLIFGVFAIVGGLVVRFVVKNQSETGQGNLPPRGVPWDSE